MQRACSVSIFYRTPSGFADGELKVIDSGLGKAMAEVVWVKVWTNPFEGVFEGYVCGAVDSSEKFSVAACASDVVWLACSLTEKAKASPCLRMNHDLRNEGESQSPRMLNAIEPGSSVPFHRHRNSMETVVCIRSCTRQIFYDDNGEVVETVDLVLGGDVAAINIPMG